MEAAVLTELPFKHHQTFKKLLSVFAIIIPPCSSILQMMRRDRLSLNRWFSDFQARCLVWLMLYSACLPTSFFTLPQNECNLCLWADMLNISFSFNGLINTSVHKVLTTFCSLNISVNPVFCFESGWLSQHVVLVVSQCSPSCHQWGTWSVWISFDFPKIWEKCGYLWAHVEVCLPVLWFLWIWNHCQ